MTSLDLFFSSLLLFFLDSSLQSLLVIVSVLYHHCFKDKVCHMTGQMRDFGGKSIFFWWVTVSHHQSLKTICMKMPQWCESEWSGQSGHYYSEALCWHVFFAVFFWIIWSPTSLTFVATSRRMVDAQRLRDSGSIDPCRSQDVRAATYRRWESKDMMFGENGSQSESCLLRMEN